MEIENEPILIDAGDVFVLVQMLFNALVHAAQHFVALARAKHAVNQLEVIKLGRNHAAGLRALHPAQEAGVVISAGQRIDIRRAMQALAVIPINNQHTAHQKTANESNHEQACCAWPEKRPCILTLTVSAETSVTKNHGSVGQ